MQFSSLFCLLSTYCSAPFWFAYFHSDRQSCKTISIWHNTEGKSLLSPKFCKNEIIHEKILKTIRYLEIFVERYSMWCAAF